MNSNDPDEIGRGEGASECDPTPRHSRAIEVTAAIGGISTVGAAVAAVVLAAGVDAVPSIAATIAAAGAITAAVESQRILRMKRRGEGEG